MRINVFLWVALCLIGILGSSLLAQVDAKMMRYADVSETQIVFVFGGDIWVVPKEGGTANQVTHSQGEESWPRFSPDGKWLAFTANYNGNPDIYVMPSSGGLPTRVTYHSLEDRMIDWHPDGKTLLFASGRESGRQSFSQFFMVDASGGLAVKLDLPYGELASFSSDGKQLAYITRITEDYPFKRYRGGLTSDILVYDFQTKKVDNITEHRATDGKPAWVGSTIYYLSDRGSHMRLNLWAYDTVGKSHRQITQFDDFDISYLAAGPSDLIFEHGGNLHRLDLASGQIVKVPIHVISDLSVEMTRQKDVSREIQSATASPSGKRVVFEARGELFNVPAKDGFVQNLTQSSSAFDRDPSFSPDGKWIAFWSDRSGEYELYLQSPEGKDEPRQLTKRAKGFGYELFWSPDSQLIAFIDETNTIQIIDIESGDTSVVSHTLWNLGHPGRLNYPLAWSPDSRWLAYHRGLENSNNAIFIFDTKEQLNHQVTSGFYSDRSPEFSEDGNYLFYLTDRNMRAQYSDFDGTWIYPNSTQIASLSLSVKTPSLLAPKNDQEKAKEDKGEDKKDKKTKKKGKKAKEEAEDKEKDVKVKPVKIDFENLESRLTILPPAAGNMIGLIATKGNLLFLKRSNTGAETRDTSLRIYDFEERKDELVLGGVQSVSQTSDGKLLLVGLRGKFGFIKPAPKQKLKDPIPLNGLKMAWNPREEWRQIFNDTWRRYRDFFYDPAMHEVDWEEMKRRYGALIDSARTRWDVREIQRDLISELSAGHTYARTGDVEQVERERTGFLGIDWSLDDAAYSVKRIVRPAVWDTEVRSPFDQPGVDVQVGDRILAVNGIRLDLSKDPNAAFEGLSGQTVNLSVQRGDAQPKSVVVTCLTPREETQLRYLEWIETNRKRVEKLSDGKLGYVYMSNTAGRGQLELVRMFYGQLDKKGFIIDERFNGGGQLADRFLELLKRPVVYNLHWRHGRDHQYPVKTNTGPMGMLINGWAGSGGDGLPWAFQELKAGPIVGERTLGILVGPATGHRLIDGGAITVPGARLYDNDGHWFWEGEGVKPDIEVWDDPNILMQGRDPQLERVVVEVLKLLETQPPRATPAPAPEDRTAKGLKAK